MPHIDEGRLHAYLDGESEALGRSAAAIERHLESCAACRSRLEEARRLRADADAILAGATPPAEETPPFASVQERAGAGDAAAATARRRRSIARYRGLRNLAWAASLVLALGLGWLARDMLRVDAPPASESPESLERFESRPTGAGAGEAAEPAAADDRIVTEPAPTPDADEVRGRRPAAPPAQTAPATRDAAAAPPPEARQDADDLEAPRLESIVVTGAAREHAAEPGDGTAAAAEQEAPARQRARRAASADNALLNQAFGGSDWRPVDHAEAAAMLGAPLWQVDNLAVLSIVARSEAGPVVRTTQRVDDYRLIELFQRPAVEGRATALDVQPAPAEIEAEIVELTVLRDDQAITARSRLPLGAMEVLLRRLRPVR